MIICDNCNYTHYTHGVNIRQIHVRNDASITLGYAIGNFNSCEGSRLNNQTSKSIAAKHKASKDL